MKRRETVQIDLQARAEAAEARLAAFEAVVGPATEAVRKATPAGTWGGAGLEVHKGDAAGPLGASWHVMICGVGNYPVAWFYQRRDAESYVAAVNAIRALSEADKDRQIAQGHEEEGGGR